MLELSRAEAARIAVAAQGFAKPRPKGKVTAKHLLGVVDTVGGVQIDAVNVMARAHLMTFFSRVGPYDEEVLHKLWAPGGGLVEYWMHGTCLMRHDMWPNFAWRMRADAIRHGVDGKESAKALAALQQEVDVRGEVTAGELEVRTKKKEPWWDWTPTKSRLEYLMSIGAISVGRRGNFERTYMSLFEALPDDVVAARDAIDSEESRRTCVLTAARALGVGNVRDIRWYLWMALDSVKRVVADLIAEGALLPAKVEGLKTACFVHPDAVKAKTKTPNAAALVNAFDPMMWQRTRIQELFGFDCLLEIYVPEPKRKYGYYVQNFLLGEEFVARVDLKADRKVKQLLVQASYAEFGVDVDEVAPALAHELREVARWQGMLDVVVKPKGDFATRLAQEFA